MSESQPQRLVSITDLHQSTLIDTSSLQEPDCPLEAPPSPSTHTPHTEMRRGCDSYAKRELEWLTGRLRVTHWPQRRRQYVPLRPKLIHSDVMEIKWTIMVTLSDI